MISHIKMKMMLTEKENKYAQINLLIHDDAHNKTWQHILLNIPRLKKRTQIQYLSKWPIKEVDANKNTVVVFVSWIFFSKQNFWEAETLLTIKKGKTCITYWIKNASKVSDSTLVIIGDFLRVRRMLCSTGLNWI